MASKDVGEVDWSKRGIGRFVKHSLKSNECKCNVCF